MSDRDLRNLYENVRLGDEYSAPLREEHLYEQMLSANRGDEACGNKETTIKYIDPATKEWRCARASDKWIEDILKPGLKIADSASYLDRILKHGKSTGVFDDSMTIAHPSVKLFYDWLNTSVTRGTLMQVLNTLIGSTSMQDAFINQVKGNARFNFYELLNTTINNAVPGSRANFQLNERLSIIRPAGDEAATRGAAGPGEALLAFMYNGSKPVVGDLVFSDKNGKPRYVIELKKSKGRIGKGIREKDVKALQALFYGFNSPANVAGGLKDLEYTDEETGAYNLPSGFIKQWEGKSIADFLINFCGTDVDKLDRERFSGGEYADCLQWFSLNANRVARGQGGNSVYNTIVQWIGGIHMKNYFNKVAEFDSIAVFEPTGTIAGFDRNVILGSTADLIAEIISDKGCFFGPRLDDGGFDIQIRP